MHSAHCRSPLSRATTTLLLLASLFAGPVFAQDESGVACKLGGSVQSQQFAALQADARELNRTICLALLSEDFSDFEETQKNLFLQFGLTATEVAQGQLQDSGVTNWRAPFDDWVTRISTSEFRNKDLPNLFVGTTLSSAAIWVHFGDTAIRGELADPEEQSCGPGNDQGCKALLEDLAVAVNDYKASYRDLSLQKTRNALATLSSEWDSFLANARSQTLLDLGLTTFLERKHFDKDYLVGPPRRQWALLHPSLVIEHASDAPAGDRDKLTGAIEWLGVNWWSDSSPLFGVPFGISVASVYADRPGFESVGHGVMLHVDNKYSLGWASRSGDNSFYLSLDLLKFIEDKQKQFERYKENMISGD
jgi:hypothetical protein